MKKIYLITVVLFQFYVVVAQKVPFAPRDTDMVNPFGLQSFYSLSDKNQERESRFYQCAEWFEDSLTGQMGTCDTGYSQGFYRIRHFSKKDTCISFKDFKYLSLLIEQKKPFELKKLKPIEQFVTEILSNFGDIIIDDTTVVFSNLRTFNRLSCHDSVDMPAFLARCEKLEWVMISGYLDLIDAHKTYPLPANVVSLDIWDAVLKKRQILPTAFFKLRKLRQLLLFSNVKSPYCKVPNIEPTLPELEILAIPIDLGKKENITFLEKLPKLSFINVRKCSDTNVDLSKLPALKEVFIGKISSKRLAKLRKRNKNIIFKTFD